MYKYYMIIDGTNYNALFLDHYEAGQFLDDNEADGSDVVVLEYEEVSPAEALNDEDFAYTYAIEVVADYLFPDRQFLKWTQAEEALRQHFPQLFEA